MADRAKRYTTREVIAFEDWELEGFPIDETTVIIYEGDDADVDSQDYVTLRPTHFRPLTADDEEKKWIEPILLPYAYLVSTKGLKKAYHYIVTRRRIVAIIREVYNYGPPYSEWKHLKESENN